MTDWKQAEKQAQEAALRKLGGAPVPVRDRGNQIAIERQNQFVQLLNQAAGRQQLPVDQGRPMAQGNSDFAAYLNYLQGQQQLSLDPLQMQGAMGQMGQAMQANANRVSQNNAQQAMLGNQQALAFMNEQGQNARLDSMLPHQLAMEELRQKGVSTLLDKLMPVFGGDVGGSGYGGFQTNYGASVLPGSSPLARNPSYQPGVDRPVDGQAAGPSPFSPSIQPTGPAQNVGFQPSSASTMPQQTFQPQPAKPAAPTGWASLPGYNPANNSFSGGTAQQVRAAAAGEYGQPESGAMPYKNPNGNFTGPGGDYLKRKAMAGYNPAGTGLTRNDYLKQQPGYGPTTARYSANTKLPY